MKKSDRPLKITVVGDGTVGKTCMLVTYTKKEFPTTYIPTVFDNFAAEIIVEGVSYSVSLWDTAGQEEFERLRVLSYPNTDVFILVYAVDNRSSFNNITTKWIPELKHHCPHAQIVLVGAKVDIRKEESSSGSCVSYNEGLKVSKKIGTFLEVSAKTRENLDSLFEEAVKAALHKSKKPPKRECRII